LIFQRVHVLEALNYQEYHKYDIETGYDVQRHAQGHAAATSHLILHDVKVMK
jgi:hypothetical protein